MNLSYQNVDRLCSQIDLTQPQPLMDLGSVTLVEPFALIYLGMFLRYHNRRNKGFTIRPPRSSRVRSYLATQRFGERFNIASDPAEASQLLFDNRTSFNEVVDIQRGPYVAEDIGQRVFELLRNNSVRVDVPQVEQWISELVDNFSQHSGEDLAACAVQWYPQHRRLDFAIGDCGIGIRSSLSRNNRYSDFGTKRHEEAAVKALEPGVGRKSEGGMGLTDVSEEVASSGGSLFLSTGDGWVQVIGDDVRSGNQLYDLPGVQVELSVPEGG